MKDDKVLTISQAHATIQSTFLSGKTRSVSWRKDQLHKLGLMVQENEEAFVHAVASDLGRPAFETLVAELNPFKGECLDAYASLDNWMKSEKISTKSIWKLVQPTVFYEPKGAALIIGAFNYPIVLLLSPLIGAIAAGCTAILKPAEQSPATATLIASLLPRYLDTSAYQVITGGVPEVTELLALQFDHIFYTGSSRVGRIVAKAAAQNLTSMTLELGGKSPAVVLEDADIEKTGKRIMWGKHVNAGQTCVSPDYVLCTAAVQEKLVTSFEAALKSFEGGDGVHGAHMGRIVNDQHYQRLTGLLSGTRGKVAIRGLTDETHLSIGVTVVRDVPADDPLMKDEIFGPILPIVVVEDVKAMATFIASRESPLALYVFTSSGKERDYIFSRTRSGGFIQNDVLVGVAIPNLPFGGTGASGQGNYRGKRSFKAFSHERASAKVPWYLEGAIEGRYPPYTQDRLQTMLSRTSAYVPQSMDGSYLTTIAKGIASLVAAALVWKAYYRK